MQLRSICDEKRAAWRTNSSDFAYSMFFKVVIFCGCLGMSLFASQATELVLMSNEFVITRDFSQIVLKDADIQAARVFVDIDRLVMKDSSQSELAQLRQIAVNGLSARLALVQKREDANYIVQLRMELYRNYAIRNPQREPALGFVLASICRYPIKDVPTYCENLQYYFFKPINKLAAFRNILDMWVNTIIPSQSR